MVPTKVPVVQYLDDGSQRGDLFDALADIPSCLSSRTKVRDIQSIPDSTISRRQ